MEIKQVMSEIYKNAEEKGFWEDGQKRNIGESLMLCVSELSEALEAHRKSKFAEKSTVDVLMKVEKDRIFASDFENHIKDTYEDELADTVIRIFDLCEGFGIDLESHIRLKLEYNKTRPYKHGKSY